MEKEKIPTLPTRKGCNHKISLPLYARGNKEWISTKKIQGKMTYICIKCGAYLDRGFTELTDAVYTEGVKDEK